MQFPSKCFLAACVAGAAVLHGAAARNAAGCEFRAVASARVELDDAVARAWQDIGAFACADESDELEVTDIDVQVEAVARAFAEAVAEVTADCTARGNARVRTTGTAAAQARAVAYGEAISRVFANTEVCGQCTAAVDALSRTSRQLVAEATAEVWVDISLVSTAGSSASQSVGAVSRDVEETVAQVLAGIVGTIRSGANDGCSIDVINEARVGDYFARCELDVFANDRIISTDGVAAAAQAARSYACGEDVTDTSIDQIVIATAHALAEAVAQANVFCAANGGDDTRACGLARSNVEAMAHAQAEAFVEVFATAETCGCAVEHHLDQHVFEEIWAEAVASSYAETCAIGTDTEFVTSFQRAVEERMITATSRALVTAISNARESGSETCVIIATECVNVGDCAGRNRLCRGPEITGVKPCCDAAYHCVRFNTEESRCLRADRPPPSFYEGTIEQPTICPEPEDEMEDSV